MILLLTVFCTDDSTVSVLPPKVVLVPGLQLSRLQDKKEETASDTTSNLGASVSSTGSGDSINSRGHRRSSEFGNPEDYMQRTLAEFAAATALETK